ncbi:MAG: TIGR04283 family arsenosugar biosynthesis glycosyltransferase [Hyphomonadaceae bacterium]|nr:TIGR04283 family arsenosugar biosynthesis glycosyltransferase [Hyphomonadaceae bacterium]
MAVSIIIPTLNEAEALPQTLENMQRLSPAPLDVVVADAGSVDATPALARDAGVTLLSDLPKGRAGQMNAGAAAAKGDVLCFLHADTIVPDDFVTLAEQVLRDERTALAGFVSVMRGPSGVRRVTTAHNFIKTWYAPLLFRPISFFRGCRLLFGDQVMICRRADFEDIGGWDPDQAIMEEADLCLRMVRGGRGRVRQVPRKVWSSDRRVAEWGFWRANLTYLYVGLMWGFGASSARLSKHYEDVR